MSFDVVLWHAFAVAVHEPEVVLGGGVSLFGGQAVPPDGFSLAEHREAEGGASAINCCYPALISF